MRGAEVQVRDGADRRLRVVDGDRLAESRGKRANLLEFGEARGLHDVGLNDVYPAFENEVTVLVVRVQVLARCYR